MSDLVLRKSGLSRSERRMVQREIAVRSAEVNLAVGEVDGRAEVQAAQVHAVKYVANEALMATADVSLRSAQLSQVVPGAAGRLHAIADAMAIAALGIVGDTAHKVSK